MRGFDQPNADASPQQRAPVWASEARYQPPPFATGAHLKSVLLRSLLTVLAGVCCIFAGEQGQIAGKVTVCAREPRSGAVVTLSAPNEAGHSVTTDQEGRYSFPVVKPGTYSLSVQAAGYKAAKRTRVVVTAGASIVVDWQLDAPGGPTPCPASPAEDQPGFYDDTPLKASAVKTAIDAAGYSSQAQSPQQLISEGPALNASPSHPPMRTPGSPSAAETERMLQQSWRDHPDSFEANRQLGEFYLSAGEFNASIPYLEKAQRLQPQDSANGNDLAAAYLGNKDPARARSLLQDMLSRKDSADLHNLLGQADEALGDPASALREFQTAARMDPSEKNLFALGNELLTHDALEPAIEVLERGVALHPGSQRMFIELGIAYYSRNLYDKAVEALCHASDLAPSDARPYLFLGKMYNVAPARANEITARMQRFTTTNPANAWAYYYYALSLWQGGRGGGAETADLAQVEALLRKAISLDPALGDAHLRLASLLQDQHRDPEALSEFQAAVRCQPDNPEGHYRLAQAYLRAGDKNRAQQESLLCEKLHQQQADDAAKRRRESPELVLTPGEAPKTNP